MAIGNKKVTPKLRDIREGASIIDMLNQPAELYPSKACFRYRRKGADCAVNYSEMKQFVDSFAAGLIGLGLGKEHVAVIGEKSPEWVIAFLGIIEAGGVAVPLDKDLSFDEIPGFVQFADCKAAVYTQKYAEAFENSDERLSEVEKFFKIDLTVPAEKLLSGGTEELEDKFNSFTSFIRYGNSLLQKGLELPDPNTHLDDLALIIFTSGTTGTSKGVMLSQRNMAFVCNQSVKHVELTDSDVLLSLLPLHHTYEMTAGLLSPMLCGATICINDNLSSLLADFRHYRPTLMAVVPLIVTNMAKRIDSKIASQGREKTVAMAKMLGDGLYKLGFDVRRKLFAEILEAFGGRLRGLVCGGAALDPKLVGKFASFGISVQQGYGITECAPVIAIIPYDVPNPASCGRLLEGMQIYIDKENCDDKTGEICVKGPNVMLGYYKNKEATDDVLTNRGWFCTGDCGYVDDNKFIYITGRKKNVIVLGNGKNIFPEEIEEYLAGVPFISDCMVTAREGADKKLVLTVIIYPDYDEAKKRNALETEEDLKNFYKSEIAKLNRKLPAFKQIRNIEIRKSPFPKTSTQKIKRHKVKEGE